MGFRRFLAAIYTHTSAHIVAAPMAHYMAKNNSRFMYSHDDFYMPVHGVLQMLTDQSMIMKFRRINGTQVAYHSAMDYLYRPLAMENMPMYQFYRDMEFTSLREAKASKKEYFEYTEKHPCGSADVVVYRKKLCVPVFGWTWIGCTKDFYTSLLTESKKTDPDYQIKEDYAKRFMVVFMPIRKLEDLKKEGSYQVALQAAHAEGLCTEEMLEVADNIQTIQSSIDAGMPENPLTADTELVEADDFQAEDPNSDQSDLLASIAELFASESGERRLTEETTAVNPSFSKSQLQENRFIPDSEPVLVQPTPLWTVLEEPQDAGEEIETELDEDRTTRWRTTTSELNTLFMQQILVTRDADGDAESGAPAITVKATGTWESVVAWGINAGLDEEQQIAFQVLVATYVLTFYEEAERRENEDEEAYSERMQPLRDLARREMTKKDPLRLFVTGPAGAGKCKCEHWGDRTRPEMFLC